MVKNRDYLGVKSMVKWILICIMVMATESLAIDYPSAIKPGTAVVSRQGSTIRLKNNLIQLQFSTANNQVRFDQVINKHTKQSIGDTESEFFQITINNDKVILCSQMRIMGDCKIQTLTGHKNACRMTERFNGKQIVTQLVSEDKTIKLNWTLQLRDGANYIRQFIRIEPLNGEVTIKSIRFLSLSAQKAEVSGVVSGSPIVAGNIFAAYEHPLAASKISDPAEAANPACEKPVTDSGVFGFLIPECAVDSEDPKRNKELKRMNCYLDRNTTLTAGQLLEQSSVIGVVPEGQLRRGFLYYLERERAQPYRQYLHYNSWYHLNIDRKVENRMTEPECLETIDDVGRELVEKRGVTLEGFVWDDGWDNFNSLWEFHDGFPNGFSKMAQVAGRYNSKTGVWLSPYGGYGHARNLRLEYGKKHGYEINQSGFSLAGPMYYKCYRDRCVQMMRDYGVNFFKFDGVGGGNLSFSGLKTNNSLANDVDAMLKLIGELRQENPSVYISATVGTWASPYFLFYADNTWRQGFDTGFHGKGPMREKWITYRDMFVYSHVVKAGSLYPLNALMPHGLVVGNRSNPGKMERDHQLINNEVWMMFACGTNLLELYITPELLTQKDWDIIARAAKWGRENDDVLVDTHWIGGNPAKAQIYGYASWSPRKGIMVLRNPDENAKEIMLDIGKVFELPEGAVAKFKLTSPQKCNQNKFGISIEAGIPYTFKLNPFEVQVFDAMQR